jgi:hypothetical protein
MQWNGEWKPTIPMTRTEIGRMSMVGIASLVIDGQEVRCEVMSNRRSQPFARTLDQKRWFQLVPQAK